MGFGLQNCSGLFILGTSEWCVFFENPCDVSFDSVLHEDSVSVVIRNGQVVQEGGSNLFCMWIM